MLVIAGRAHVGYVHAIRRGWHFVRSFGEVMQGILCERQTGGGI
ncbi:hypothetical protein HMPREF0591_1682 [Mycobacterium parascrofulaceum ATCC BAA-614]|uniref:Uncharacterized protein n=1 Tax=Mycobacterium parascrofulaceum ATCC BAA-614 TaxID=525368 RepID=D5P688_9MYCO|nr:hypothetical protein HMPREF0591_1682 [Mycobacterium parascrofulaceum ATCC BAA-614]